MEPFTVSVREASERHSSVSPQGDPTEGERVLHHLSIPADLGGQGRPAQRLHRQVSSPNHQGLLLQGEPDHHGRATGLQLRQVEQRRKKMPVSVPDVCDFCVCDFIRR